MSLISQFRFALGSRSVRRMGGLILIAFFAAIVNAQSPTPTPLPSEIELPPKAPLPADPPPVGPDFSSPQRPLPSVERVGVSGTEVLSLTIDDAIRMALEKNNDIEIAKAGERIAEFRLLGARGVFDPLINGESYYERATTPTASAIGGAVNGAVTQTRFFGTGGISGFTPRFGGSYAVRIDASRTTTSNTNAFLNPQFPSVLALTYVQPLWRGLRIDNNRRNIQIAQRNVEISGAQLKQQTTATIASVEQAYWDLVYALRSLQVQIDAVRQAREQFESNRRQVDRGVLAPIELVASSAQITALEQSVYAAQENVTRFENLLKTLVLPDRTSRDWGLSVTPTSPLEIAVPDTSLQLSIEEALRTRPEIAILEENVRINEIDQRYFRDQTKPEINLVGSYTSQGLAGTETPAAINPATGLSRVPENLVGGIGRSFGNLLQQDYPTYRVGVTIGIPWGNRTARANLGVARVEGEQLTTLRARTEQAIEAEVRNAIQSLRSSEARLASARASRISAEQLAESEERQFRAGTTTFYLVQQRQTDLLAARGAELQARTDLNKAISEYYRVTGRTLEVNNIELK